nr:hypothetical protein [Corynebacterium lactis]
MAKEYASAGTLSHDETLPWVVRIFVYTDEQGSHAAARKVRDALSQLIPDEEVQVYEDVMPDVGRTSSLADLWAEANPGVDPGERKRYRISVVAPGLSHAELADLSGPLAEAVSPGWSAGSAASQVADGNVPCRVAVGRADEHPGEPPLVQN